MINLVVNCIQCGAEFIITVREEDFLAWQAGGLAQNCFPYLTPEEREMLISHICGDCWSKMFGD